MLQGKGKEKMSEKYEEFKKYIRDVPDWPKKGIIFKDITTLLKEKRVFKEVVNLLARRYRHKKIDQVVAVEARGFILGAILAHKLGAGFVPIRKKGKLPAPIYRATYDLEYGRDTLEVHRDAVKPGERVLIIDDLLATGGTTGAVIELVRRLKGKVVGIAFLIELTFLKGRKRIKCPGIYSMIKY